MQSEHNFVTHAMLIGNFFIEKFHHAILMNDDHQKFCLLLTFCVAGPSFFLRRIRNSRKLDGGGYDFSGILHGF